MVQPGKFRSNLPENRVETLKNNVIFEEEGQANKISIILRTNLFVEISVEETCCVRGIY